MKLSKRGNKILKTLHLMTASCWLGGSIALGLAYPLKNTLNSQDAIYGINLAMHHIDVWLVIIPGAIGCFMTGLIYSIYTNWGFFKFHWITVKWTITVTAILLGTFYLGPWIQDMISLSAPEVSLGKKYEKIQNIHFIFATIQTVFLLFVVYLSVFKPWKQKS